MIFVLALLLMPPHITPRVAVPLPRSVEQQFFPGYNPLPAPDADDRPTFIPNEPPAEWNLHKEIKTV